MRSDSHDAIPCYLNPKAGTARRSAEAVADDERFRLHECGPDAMRAALQQAASRGVRRIAVAGGDGTVSMAAGVLAGSGVELAVLPGGTLNHFARSFGIPVDLRLALDVAAESASRAVDAGYLNERLFVNTSSVGAYVTFVQARERWEPRIGYYGASAVAAGQTLGGLPTYGLELEVEGRLRRYHTPMVFVGVGERELRFPSFGERADPGQRGLHAIVLKGNRRLRLLALGFSVAARGIGTASRTRHLDSFVVERCAIELPQAEAYVAVDGETVRMASPLRYRIAHAALQVVAPSRTEGA